MGFPFLDIGREDLIVRESVQYLQLPELKVQIVAIDQKTKILLILHPETGVVLGYIGLQEGNAFLKHTVRFVAARCSPLLCSSCHERRPLIR